MDPFPIPAHLPIHPRQTTILIAEDDDGHATLIERNLRRCGYTNPFIRFRDGQETLDFLLQTPASRRDIPLANCLLLLDINMPKVDGTQVLRHMHSHKTLQEIPVAVLSTSGDMEDRETLQSLGCRHYLEKPVDTKTLKTMLTQFNIHPSLVQ